jgi:hypothetical protein
MTRVVVGEIVTNCGYDDIVTQRRLLVPFELNHNFWVAFQGKYLQV